MPPKTDKKFSEVFDAAEKAGQFLQNKKNIIGGLALGATTAPLGLPGNQIVDGIKNTVGNIQAASSFANSNPQIQNILNNEYTGLAAGLNPVTSAAYMFGKGSQLAPVASTAVSGLIKPTKTKKSEDKTTYPTVAELQTIKPSRDYQKEKQDKEQQEIERGAQGTGPKLDPNATERYASNFKAGQANMSDIQEMYADRKDLQEWAKANPALAQKEFAKSGFQSTRMKNADIQDQMDDTGRSRDDIIAINNGGLETVIDGSSIGKSTPVDAQAFKDAAAQLVVKGQLPSSMNAGSTPIISGVTPMIEGIELSTTIKPDYKSEMEDGVMNQLAKGLDIPTTRFASQDLKDLFMNNMLGK